MKYLAWLPIVGIAIEAYMGGGYLSDLRHPVRFYGSSFWHCLWAYTLLRLFVL